MSATTKRTTRSSASSEAESSPVPKPRQQDNVPSGTPRKRASAAAAAASKQEKEQLLDVDAMPVEQVEEGSKAEPRFTGNVPHGYKGLPPFTLKQLRDAIPAHCFERSFWRSFSYVIYDGIALAVMYASMYWLTSQSFWAELPYPARAAGWALWGWITGIFGTGWWVLAHGEFLESSFWQTGWKL